MYDPLRRDADGLAWELRGQGVQCLTEQEFLNDAGQKQRTGQADPTAQKWADTFTEKFDELAREDSSFGQLRNVMDLAVVGALLVKEGLLERSGLDRAEPHERAAARRISRPRAWCPRRPAS